MPEPERDAQLPREAVPVTVTAANRAPDGPECPEVVSEAHRGAEGVLGAHDWSGCRKDCREQHTYNPYTCELGPEPEPTVLVARHATGPDGEPCIAIGSVPAACLRPDTCHPGDPCSPCLARGGSLGDPRQAAHDAVYQYIRELGDHIPSGPVHRNAIIWRAVHAALDAAELDETERDALEAQDYAQKLTEENDRLSAELADWRHNLAQRAFTAPDADLDTVLESLDARIRDAINQSAPAVQQPPCTATLTAHGKTHHCALPAGHYDEAREPSWPDDDSAVDPGGWHSISAQPGDDTQIWADRAIGATPHQEDQ